MWKKNFEASYVKPLLTSKGFIQSNLLDKAMLCTLTHHFCTKSCSLNVTLNFLMKFLNMD